VLKKSSSRGFDKTRLFGTGRSLVTRHIGVSSEDTWLDSADIRRYELLFGKRPFRGRTNTGLTQAILHEALKWPEDAPGRCSTEGMQAIKAVRSLALSNTPADSAQFLERDPNKRLGYRPGGGGMADIKSHPWFKGIDWEALYNKEVVPPFEPDVSARLPRMLALTVTRSRNEQISMRHMSWKNSSSKKIHSKPGNGKKGKMWI
jgi:hypothetical protein